MSAYVVSNETINCIVNSMIDNRVITRVDAEEVGQILLDQNFSSVNYQYDREDEPTEFEFERRGQGFSGILARPDETYNDSDAWGCLRCWMYQSCEDPDFECSDAWRLATRLERKLIDKAYPDAPWGLD